MQLRRQHHLQFIVQMESASGSQVAHRCGFVFSSGGGSRDSGLTNGRMICHDCEEPAADFISSERHGNCLH